jgi:hypothetical protein
MDEDVVILILAVAIMVKEVAKVVATTTKTTTTTTTTTTILETTMAMNITTWMTGAPQQGTANNGQGANHDHPTVAHRTLET